MKSKKRTKFIYIDHEPRLACASNAYAEINERPKYDATYDEKVVLNLNGKYTPDEYSKSE